MKLITQKQPFCGDFYIIKSTISAPISSFSGLLIVFLLTLFLNYNAFAAEKNDQQIPVRKTIVAPVKKVPSSKIVKGKKGKNGKKSVVIKKDTLIDVDPASANSPLFNN